MTQKIKGRVFIVGCSRSGTTLLQSRLAAHPEVISFIESAFFYNIFFYRFRHKFLNYFSIGAPKARKRLEWFLDEIGESTMKSYIPEFMLFRSDYISTFVKVLDLIAEKHTKTVWIEKTPIHIRYIDVIEKSVQGAKFIHIVRNGPDVVASLFLATNTYSQMRGRALSIDECINQWLNDVNISPKYQNQQNHAIVRYETFVQSPADTLARMCEFVGVTFDDCMMSNPSISATKVVLKEELWKASIFDPIQEPKTGKFDKIFKENERDYILKRLGEIDLETLFGT